ncbi:hypothetical protein T484DRAFT_1852791 [Baffinella frigidus]|nr:hypothetical protein T484DRAFT_1852791 [Cryptophyta sp. CCMP2293]
MTGRRRTSVQLGDREVVRFDEGAYGRTVEARVADREWRRGSLVALVKGSELWGVAFEDGDWAEDARFVHADINLEEHKDAKDAMKPYVCEACCKAFPRADTLDVHLRAHLRGR